MNSETGSYSPVSVESVFCALETVHHPTMLEAYSHNTPFQLLVMTMLSARTKDATTIPIAQKLFVTCPDAASIVRLPLKELEQKIFGTGFYRVKAKHLQALCQKLLDKFGGVVPQTVTELTSLPGVGRKTAHCVLSYVFGIPAIAVDIHVHRIANRLGWITTQTPLESEQALARVVAKPQWNNINRLLVSHGQHTCLPRVPQCSRCVITKHCQYFKERI